MKTKNKKSSDVCSSDLPSVSGDLQLLFCPYRFPCCERWVRTESCNIWPFIFFHLVCFQGSSLLCHESLLHSFLCAGSYGNSLCNFLKSWHTVFQSNCNFLYSHQQCMRVPVFPHPHPHLFLPVLFLVIAILVGVGPAATFCLYLSGLIQVNVTET